MLYKLSPVKRCKDAKVLGARLFLNDKYTGYLSRASPEYPSPSRHSPSTALAHSQNLHLNLDL